MYNITIRRFLTLHLITLTLITQISATIVVLYSNDLLFYFWTPNYPYHLTMHFTHYNNSLLDFLLK